MGDLDPVPSSQLPLDPTPTVVAIWEVNKQVGNLSSFQINRKILSLQIKEYNILSQIDNKREKLKRKVDKRPEKPITEKETPNDRETYKKMFRLISDHRSAIKTIVSSSPKNLQKLLSLTISSVDKNTEQHTHIHDWWEQTLAGAFMKTNCYCLLKSEHTHTCDPIFSS